MIPHATCRAVGRWSAVWVALVLITLVPLMIWCIWHDPMFDESMIEQRIMLTWLVLALAGLLPGAGLLFAIHMLAMKVGPDERGEQARDNFP